MKCENCLVLPACTEFCKEAEKTLKNLLKIIILSALVIIGSITAFIIILIYPYLVPQLKTALGIIYLIMMAVIFIGVTIEEKDRSWLNFGILVSVCVFFPIVLLIALTLSITSIIIQPKLKKMFVKAKKNNFTIAF